MRKIPLKKNKKRTLNRRGSIIIELHVVLKNLVLGSPKLFINSQNKIRAVLVATSMPPFGIRTISPKIFVLKSLEKVFFYLKFARIKKNYFLCDLEKIGKKGIFVGGGGSFEKKTYFLVHLFTQRIKPMSELEHFVIPLNRIKKN